MSRKITFFSLVLTFIAIIIFTFPSNELYSKDDPVNAISFQPLGFLFSWTNLEYERKISTFQKYNAVTITARILVSTENLGLSLLNGLPGNDQWLGFGLGSRVYYSPSKSMKGIYLGVDFDYMADPNDNTDLARLSLEFGRKIFFFYNCDGLFICGQALVYILLSKPGKLKSPYGYITCSLGYQF